MRSVAMLTITGVIALVFAVLTGSTPLAVIVVALAVSGIVLLVRDWRADRAAGSGRPAPVVAAEMADGPHHLRADEFSPDISTDPDGPSSDARADQQ